MPFGILPERCRIHPSLTKLKNGAEGIKIWLTKNPLIESIHQAKIQLRWPLKAIICWSENRILLFADILSSSQKNARLFFYEFNFKCWLIVQVCICTFLIAIQSFIFKQIQKVTTGTGTLCMFWYEVYNLLENLESILSWAQAFIFDFTNVTLIFKKVPFVIQDYH